VRVHVCVRDKECVCVCVFGNLRISVSFHERGHLRVSVRTCVRELVCVCVRERERESARARDRERERERARDYACMCSVCLRVFACVCETTGAVLDVCFLFVDVAGGGEGGPNIDFVTAYYNHSPK